MTRVWKSVCLLSAFLMTMATLSVASGRGAPQSADDQPTHPEGPTSLLGFSPRSAPGQLAAEAHAITVPTPENARKTLHTITAEPHVAGTPADYKNAVFVRDKLREWGWKADIAEMEVLLNYPAAAPEPHDQSPCHQDALAR